ncbi:MAG: glycosyltransferase [Rhodocyclales bacterium]|nr:glycosyltransferase [Rhodocyclales bacterium]
MNLLLLHQNFPGQFRHIAAHFAALDSLRVVAIGEARNLARATGLHRAIELRAYPTPQAASGETHPYVQPFEVAVKRGLEVVRLAAELKSSGFVPDLIIGHPGWGETLFIRDVFPAARLVLHAEFFYQSMGADVGFDPEFPSRPDDAYRLRTKNATQWMSLGQADSLFAPTAWQKSCFPGSLQDRIEIVHDGIDTAQAKPNVATRITLARAGVTLGYDDEVVTFVARNLEPYRGFHQFMRALPRLLALRPKARVLIVGGDEVSYGSRPADGRTWRRVMLDELGGAFDASRVHFLGKLPYAGYLQVLQVSTVHAYLTYPFVLSWSMLEAMSSGCMLVASRTAPVEEVISHGDNGWLVDFFNPESLAATLADALAQRESLRPLRQAARQTVIDRFDLRGVCLPRQIALLNALNG